MDKRKQRIQQEVILLARRFLEVDYDDEDFGWIRIPKFELPDGWSKRYTALLILLPPAYPDVPPDGFYIDKGLATKSGKPPSHYFQGRDHNRLYDKNWAWYCIHAEKDNWQPSANLLKGDNLLKYIELIRAVLTKIAKE